ncbi:alpha/beta hydrolase [Microbulbifer epialgicus]|uniref:Alpha/beta hydrolase n=1 Tax=Microbulbifer epialgicus TaxID=393907 RepID=A0ABV4P637_9GAMM
MHEAWAAFTWEKTDEQYNPTLWTRRLPTEELLPAHVEITSGRSDTYRRKVSDGLQTVCFGKGDFVGSMDIFRPANVADNAPILVYIHGGWWQWFSKEQFSYLAEPFNKKGIAVYMPGYRMAQEWDSESPMESIVTQLQWAMVSVFKEAEKKGASKVYLMGHSAGGHLVAVLHQIDWRKFEVSNVTIKKLKGVFSLAGLFDIRPLVNSFVNDTIQFSMASAAKVSPQLLTVSERHSPCPLHLIVPEFDTPEFFRQTKEYQEKLLKADWPCHFILANNRDHLDLIERLSNDNDEVLEYILLNMN